MSVLDTLLLVIGCLWLYSRLCISESAWGYQKFIDEMEPQTSGGDGATHAAA